MANITPRRYRESFLRRRSARAHLKHALAPAS